MDRSRQILLCVCLILAGAAGMGRADARGGPTVVAAACAAPQTWTFAPALTPQVRSGTITVTQSAVCVAATVSTDPPSETVSVPTITGSAVLSYFGDCTFAVVTSGDLSFVLVNGMVIAGADPQFVFAGSALVVPDQVCNEVTATGPAVAIAAVHTTGS